MRVFLIFVCSPVRFAGLAFRSGECSQELRNPESFSGPDAEWKAIEHKGNQKIAKDSESFRTKERKSTCPLL